MFRRAFTTGIVLALATCLPRWADASHAPKSSRLTKPVAKRLPSVELSHLSTHETFVLRPDAGGRLGPKQLRGFKHFLRCHHTGREHGMSAHLAQLLYTTSRHFGGRSISVIAGYRAPKIARQKGNPRSPHKRGVACDFRVAGVGNTALRDYLRATFHGVGVGFYPNAGFVHLDVDRKRSAFWIDYSGPGERAEYSSNPELDLRDERAGRARKQRADAAAGAEPDSDDDEKSVPDDDPGVAGLSLKQPVAAPPD